MHRFRTALVAVSFPFLVSAGVVHARPITLQEALALVDGSPDLALAAASLDEARGKLEQAGTYNFNPVVSATAGPAFGMGGGGTLYDFEIGISQAIELGGKRSARKRVARAERDAATEVAAATRTLLQAEVRRAFELALVAQARVAVTTENEGAARHFRDAAGERLQAGAATQTDVNVAVAILGRAIAAKKTAERDLLLARLALGEALGVSGDLEPSGALPTFQLPSANEDALATEAVGVRRDLVAADRITAARAADVDLADALATPDPELSVAWARSEVDATNAVLVGLRVEIPIFNRNKGNLHAARTQRERAAVEAKALRGEIEREARFALRRYRAATEAVAAFDQQVVGTLAENLTLARDSLAAGKLGLLELNNVRRDLVDSQLTYLDAIAEAVEARAALETALGRSLGGNP